MVGERTFAKGILTRNRVESEGKIKDNSSFSCGTHPYQTPVGSHLLSRRDYRRIRRKFRHWFIYLNLSYRRAFLLLPPPLQALLFFWLSGLSEPKRIRFSTLLTQLHSALLVLFSLPCVFIDHKHPYTFRRILGDFSSLHNTLRRIFIFSHPDPRAFEVYFHEDRLFYSILRRTLGSLR